jgi:AmmeMemoRadiSam system protein A
MCEDEHYLTHAEERLLLRVARDTLTEWVRGGRRLEITEYALTPALQEKHGAFVTLRIAGELRGCVGYPANIEPLAVAVRDNTINAATRDLRFAPVAPHEVPAIEIEISALTPGDTPASPFKRVHRISEIVIGRDGLYIEHPPAKGGLLLPQVAVEHGWNVGQFLEATCRKAGYPDRQWDKPGTLIYRFSAQVFSEHAPAA